jgi:hypothetical protein
LYQANSDHPGSALKTKLCSGIYLSYLIWIRCKMFHWLNDPAAVHLYPVLISNGEWANLKQFQPFLTGLCF